MPCHTIHLRVGVHGLVVRHAGSLIFCRCVCVEHCTHKAQNKCNGPHAAPVFMSARIQKVLLALHKAMLVRAKPGIYVHHKTTPNNSESIILQTMTVIRLTSVLEGCALV